MRIILALIFAFTLLGCANYQVTKDLTYEHGNPFGKFDMYEPIKSPIAFGNAQEQLDRPVVIAIHGGGFMGGKKKEMHRVADLLCPLGYVVLSIDYRVTGDWLAPDGSTIKGTPWPAQIDDCQKAVAYFKENAGVLKISPTRMASLGISAGANLATHLALRPDPKGLPLFSAVATNGECITVNTPSLRAAVELDGEHNLLLPPYMVMTDYDNIVTKAMGHSAPWSDEELKNISTVYYKDARFTDSKFMLVHGAGDDNVYVQQVKELSAFLRANQLMHDVIILTGEDGNCHGNCWEKEPARSAIIKFLESNLKK